MRAIPGIAAALLVASLTAAGCGGGGADPAPSPPATPEQQVRAVVRDLGRATAAKDYRRLCTRILAPDLLRRAVEIGLPCERALEKGLAGVSAPRVSVGRVTIAGGKAEVQVTSSAAGQEPSQDTVELVRTPVGWRIAKLAGR